MPSEHEEEARRIAQMFFCREPYATELATEIALALLAAERRGIERARDYIAGLAFVVRDGEKVTVRREHFAEWAQAIDGLSPAPRCPECGGSGAIKRDAFGHSPCPSCSVGGGR